MIVCDAYPNCAMTENERLKTIRQHFKLTQKEFSMTLDIKQGSYSDVERGKAGISAILLKNLIKKYGISPLWLCEGAGNMFIEVDDNTARVSPTSCDESTSKEEKKKIKRLLKHEQQVIENIKDIIAFLTQEPNALD